MKSELGSGAPSAKTLPPAFSIMDRNKKQPNIYCASRRSETFKAYDNEKLRGEEGLHEWLEAQNVSPLSAGSWLGTPWGRERSMTQCGSDLKPWTAGLGSAMGLE